MARWERLFDDLEAQWAAGEREELRGEIADRTRRERAAVSLTARLLMADGVLEVVLASGRRCVGAVADVGEGYLLLGEGHRQWLLPLAAIVQISGLTAAAAGPAEERRVRRLGLPAALRAIARDRRAVLLEDLAGRALTGTIEIVGGDFLELSEHPLDLPPRRGDIAARRLVPLGAIVAVASAG